MNAKSLTHEQLDQAVTRFLAQGGQILRYDPQPEDPRTLLDRITEKREFLLAPEDLPWCPHLAQTLL